MERATYVYIVRPARGSFAGGMTEAEQQAMSKHFLYLKDLMEQGILVMAGPSLDTTFGIAVFKAEDEAKAIQIMKNDPAVKAGVISATVHPYKISLLKEANNY